MFGLIAVLGVVTHRLVMVGRAPAAEPAAEDLRLGAAA
jgi:hypothetical protein